MMKKSKAGKSPRLIFQASELDLADLPKIDCHLHTSWTDGVGSVLEVYGAAVESRLTTVLYSEHSRKTSTDWFSSFAAEVRALPSSPCQAYLGTEVKVESRDGDIDTIPEISGLCDFVMASVHRFIAADGTTMQFAETDPAKAVDLEYALTWAVLPNPGVDILGHMFGMSYKRFGLVPPDEKIVELIARAAEFDVAVEINSHYHPNMLKMLQWCRKYNAKVTFGSNAHTLQDVGAVVRMLGQKNPDA